MKGVHKLNQGLRIMGELPEGLEGWVHGRSLHQHLLASMCSYPWPGTSLESETDVEGQC